MSIIFFVLRLKIKILLGKSNHFSTFKNIVYLILFLLAVIYGVSFSIVLPYFQKIVGFDIQKAFFIMNLSLAFLVLLKGYFPQYVSFRNIFLNAYPIKLYQKAISILIYQFLTAINLLLVIFCIIVFIFLKEYNIVQLLISILTISIYFILEKILKTSTSFFQFIISLIIFGVIIFSYFYLYSLLLDSQNQILISLSLLLVFCFSIFSFNYNRYLAFEKNISFKTLKIFTKYKESNYAWYSLFNNKSLFNTLLLGFSFKIIIVVILIFTVVNNNKGLSNNSVIVALICSPVVFFNYIFNNLFGYKPQIFLFIGYNLSYKAWFHYYIKCIRRFLFIDFIISLAVLNFICGKIQILNVVYLLYVYSILTVYGFFASILLPKSVINPLSFTSFKSNTSLLASLSMIFFTIISYNSLGKISNFIFFIFINSVIIFSLIHFLIKMQPQKVFRSIINKII